MQARTARAAVGYSFAVVMLGTTLPTPLYALYESSLRFGELMVTVVFAAYAVGVLAALYLFGGLSDRIGRRPVLLAAVGFSAASAVCFLAQGGLALLLLGRVASGLSAGLFTGTGTAAILDTAGPSAAGRRRASLIATLVNLGGLGLGPLFSGVLSTVAGPPLRLPFAVDLALLAPAAAWLWLAQETAEPSGRPGVGPVRLALPERVRPVFVPAAMAGFAGFVVLGLFTAVSPGALGEILAVRNRAAVGAVVAAVFAASAAGQFMSGRLDPGRALPAGCLVLAAGMAVVIAGLQAASLAALVCGGVVSGLGQGLSFRAGMAAVNAVTPPADRGAVTSLFFLVLYVAISLPVVAVGVGARYCGLLAAGTTCAAAVAGLAVAACAVLAAGPARKRLR